MHTQSQDFDVWDQEIPYFHLEKSMMLDMSSIKKKVLYNFYKNKKSLWKYISNCHYFWAERMPLLQ